MKAEYKTEILTGIRPTAGLTVANYVGAVKPIIELQNSGIRPMIFAADLHALTDNEPSVAKKFTKEIVVDYIALGLDPDKTIIYRQSDIECQIYSLTNLLARHISVAELLRVPALKDKLKQGARPETANSLLLMYPVMMAADVLIHRAKEVPIGEDQLAHLEVTRELARRFNARYGEVFPLPQAHKLKAMKILSLKGKEKMSKSLPVGAIFLNDNPKEAARKIKKAETATEGKMSENLESHIVLAKELSSSPAQHEQIDEIIKAHMAKERVMGDFKNLFAEIVVELLKKFQARREKIARDPGYIDSVLESGKKAARASADATLKVVRNILYKK